MTITVYGASLSPFVRKVRAVLAEKGLEYELNQVNIFPMPDWFAEMSPLRRIPVLTDGDVSLPDSSAICGYLERGYPSPALYPTDAGDYGRALWFEEYADSELAATIGMGCFRPVVVSQLMGKAPDMDAADTTCREKLPRYLDYLNGQIEGRTYYVGDSLSIADIAVATQFVNLRHAGRAGALEDYPALLAFFERMMARPSFAEFLAQEDGFLTKMGFSLD